MSERVLSVSRGNDRLAARRRRSRRRALIALCILALLSLGAVIYGLWQPAVRISHIEVLGADTSLETIPRDALQGSYLGIIPRDSIFFFPASRIRAGILATHTNIAAISISRIGFSGISIKIDNRVPIARWCGSAVPTESGDCYLFDASGFLYATATEAFFLKEERSPAVALSNPDNTVTPFVLLSSLQTDIVSPIGATLKDTNQLPAVFDFAREIGLSGPSINTIVIRGDEVDFFLVSGGPRITYLLGDEQNAFTALVSAKAQLNLSDPTLQYVDVRFPGKLYLKRAEPPK